MFLEYLEEEEGKNTVNIEDKAFFSFTINPQTGEMFVPDLFIKREHRGTEMRNKVLKEVLNQAALNKAQFITGTVFMNEANKDRFNKKLFFYERLGFKPVNILNNVVILQRNLED